MLSASVCLTLLLNACGGNGGDGGGGYAGDSSGGDVGGRGGSGNSGEKEIDSDTLVDAAIEAAELSEDELFAALAAADLEGQMALARTSGLVTALGDETTVRAAWADIGTQMKLAADAFAAGAVESRRTLATPNLPQFPGVRVQADGGGVAEAFGAGWLGGSLFNAHFIQTAINDYSSGDSGASTDSSAPEDIRATAGLSDTTITLDVTAEFKKAGLSATISTHSKIECPDATGLMTIDSSLEITGKAGNGYQSAQFEFELIVEVDDDAQLTGRNQLTSKTKTHTADSTNGYDTTNGSVDVSITQFAGGDFGEGKGSYRGMSNDEAIGWMNAGVLSGTLYRDQLLPNLQKMLDAGRCVTITVQASDGPMNLEPFTNVDLLTKPRAKLSPSGITTGGTVQAKFKTNAGGSIAELGDKVEADATFHYIAPLDYNKTETVTFEARSKRGTGKLDYTLTTSAHAD